MGFHSWFYAFTQPMTDVVTKENTVSHWLGPNLVSALAFNDQPSTASMRSNHIPVAILWNLRTKARNWMFRSWTLYSYISTFFFENFLLDFSLHACKIYPQIHTFFMCITAENGRHRYEKLVQLCQLYLLAHLTLQFGMEFHVKIGGIQWRKTMKSQNCI